MLCPYYIAASCQGTGCPQPFNTTSSLVQAGVCFGLSAASCKTGIMLVGRVGWLAFPVGLAGSILMSSLGFMLQTLGLKDGNTVIVCTCAAVSSMGTGCQPVTLPLS